jgi:Holliday junction resolvase-like predicted endonuclease
MLTPHQIAGQKAEAYVSAALIDLGWQRLAQNLRTPYAEVDLVFLTPKEDLVVVEVKARQLGSWLNEEDSLGRRQRLRLFRAAEWLLQRQDSQQQARVDLASVDLIRGCPVQWRLFEQISLD